jgi:hypothetical protein
LDPKKKNSLYLYLFHSLKKVLMKYEEKNIGRKRCSAVDYKTLRGKLAACWAPRLRVVWELGGAVAERRKWKKLSF